MPWFSVGEWTSPGSDHCGLCCSHDAGHCSYAPRKSGLLDPSNSIWAGPYWLQALPRQAIEELFTSLVRSLIHVSSMVLVVRLPLACFLAQAGLDGMPKIRMNTKNREAWVVSAQ